MKLFKSFSALAEKMGHGAKKQGRPLQILTRVSNSWRHRHEPGFYLTLLGFNINYYHERQSGGLKLSILGINLVVSIFTQRSPYKK